MEAHNFSHLFFAASHLSWDTPTIRYSLSSFTTCTACGKCVPVQNRKKIPCKLAWFSLHVTASSPSKYTFSNKLHNTTFVNTWPNQWVWSMSKSSKHMVNYVPSAVYITIRLQFNMASMMRYYAMCTKRMILRGTNGMRADLRCWQKNEKWKRNGVLLRRLLERSKEDTPGGNRFLCKNSKQALLLTSLTMRVFTSPDSLQVSAYHQSKKIIS